MWSKTRVLKFIKLKKQLKTFIIYLEAKCSSKKSIKNDFHACLAFWLFFGCERRKSSNAISAAVKILFSLRAVSRWERQVAKSTCSTKSRLTSVGKQMALRPIAFAHFLGTMSERFLRHKHSAILPYPSPRARTHTRRRGSKAAPAGAASVWQKMLQHHPACLQRVCVLMF